MTEIDHDSSKATRVRRPLVSTLCGIGAVVLSTACGGPPPEAPKEEPAEEGAGAVASRDSGRSADEVNPLDLPDRYRDLLRSEMTQVEVGTHRLLGHLVRAEGSEAAKVAREIHDSFILKRELTEEELADLRSFLPAGFVDLDRGFHETAATLAESAEKGDLRKATRLYGKMVRTCVDCHARFARERFPFPTPGEPDLPEGEGAGSP